MTTDRVGFTLTLRRSGWSEGKHNGRDIRLCKLGIARTFGDSNAVTPYCIGTRLRLTLSAIPVEGGVKVTSLVRDSELKSVDWVRVDQSSMADDYVMTDIAGKILFALLQKWDKNHCYMTCRILPKKRPIKKAVTSER